jgi:hypothetical protein
MFEIGSVQLDRAVLLEILVESERRPLFLCKQSTQQPYIITQALVLQSKVQRVQL